MTTHAPSLTLGFAERRPVHDRTFAVSAPSQSARVGWLIDGLAALMTANGYRELAEPEPSVQVVLHELDPEHARPYRRKNAPTFVVAIAAQPAHPSDVLRTGYPLLVRGLANLAIVISGSGLDTVASFVTLEQGTYAVHHEGDDDAFFAAVFDRVEPLASSRLVIANEFRPDLPPDLWAGDDQTRAIQRAGERLARLDLLPAAFPIEEILSARDLRHVKLLYGIGGLSYGNVSARRCPAVDDGAGPHFWMSASGVDKSRLTDIGRDIHLVTGFDPSRDLMQISVPTDVEPTRVSVDAIEHWTIYREHPEVGAILHVHGWIEGTPATEINYPCGTVELAVAVADLVRRAPEPGRAIVGQRNHGLTVTGPSLDEIFDRIDGRVVRKVPMD